MGKVGITFHVFDALTCDQESLAGEDPILSRFEVWLSERPRSAFPSEADACSALGCGRSCLKTHCKRIHTSFRAIRQGSLMQAAARLLGQLDLPVKQIGISLGYGSHRAFTRAFVMYFGEPPTHYRRVRWPRLQVPPPPGPEELR